MEARRLKTVTDLIAHPDGRVELIDGEIVSPGHERKDTLTLLLLPQRHRVPFYWLIWPEDRSLIAYRLEDGRYHLDATLSGTTRACVPPFADIALDLGYILGQED